MGLLAILAVGCAAPGVEIVRPRCKPVWQPNSPKSVAFVATIRTQHLAGHQLVYKVRFRDTRSRPVKSTDGRFQDARGNVAATKTLMVLQSPWTFRNVRVAIPTAELGLRRGVFPAAVEFGVYRPDGELITREYAVFPYRLAVWAASQQGGWGR